MAEGREEVGESLGDTAHHVAAVPVLGEQEGQLEQRLLCQLHFPAVGSRQFISDVFCYLFANETEKMRYSLVTQAGITL